MDKVEAWTHDKSLLNDPTYRSRHLANVLIYWLTRTATSAANNNYAEYAALFADPSSFINSGVPTAVFVSAEDISIRRFAEQANTIARWSDLETGGHFAALEQPESLLADLRAFVRVQGRRHRPDSASRIKTPTIGRYFSDVEGPWRLDQLHATRPPKAPGEPVTEEGRQNWTHRR